MTDSDVDRDDLQDSSESEDEPVTLPEAMPRATEWGTTVREQEEGETINQRIAQEEPDPDSAYGAPDNESGLDEPARVGGDDPDAIDPEQDWLGDDPAEDGAGRLVSDDAGDRPDSDAQDWATDVGDDGGGASAEESAMHVVTGDEGATSTADPAEVPGPDTE